MPKTTQTLLLWLFVINLGIAFGAGLFEHRIVFGRWLQRAPGSGRHWNAEAARADDTGRRFWAYVTTVPLTLLTLANVYAAWVASPAARAWWLAAALISLAERIFTFSYFIPTMVRLMNAEDSAAAVARASRWSKLNLVRHALSLTAWLAALEAWKRLGFTTWLD